MIASILLLAASAAPAQHWEIEQVDSAPWGGPRLEARVHPDGRVFVCYSNDTGAIRIAWRDSTWHHEDIPTSRRPVRNTAGFDVGPHGEVGVAAITDSNITLVELVGASWRESLLPSYGTPRGTAPLCFDTSGNPMVLVTAPGAVKLAHRQDSTWQCKLVDSAYWSSFIWGGRLLRRSDNQPCVLYRLNFYFPQDIQYASLKAAVRSDTGWTAWSLVAADYGTVAAWAGALDRSNAVHSSAWYLQGSWPSDSGFVYDHGLLDVSRPIASALVLDASGRPMVARSYPDDLEFRFRSGAVWLLRHVVSESIVGLDMVVGDNGQPRVIYTDSSGVWFARGVGVLGVEEPKPAPEVTSTPLPTFAREVLNLQSAICNLQSAMVLLDISGRRVLDLVPGPNDVSHLSPGVYFVATTEGVTGRVVKVR